jgi:hypothetical protein
MVYLLATLDTLSPSLSNSTDDHAAFAHSSSRRFSGCREVAKNPVNENNCRENFQCRRESAARVHQYPAIRKPNNMIILIKHDNYTRSVIFLCKCSSFLLLYRTSGALPERLESLRSAEGPSRAHGRFCSLASPSGATDCQPLKPALQARLSSGCRRR